MGSLEVSTSHHLYPPFSDKVDTAPLVSISLAKLQSGDNAESKAFYEAAKDLGFFYLELQGCELGRRLVDEAESLNAIQKEFYARPQHERDEFSREKVHDFFGYRKIQLKDLKEDGTPKLNEMYNMRKDDFVGNTDPLPTHDLIKQNWDLFKSYTLHVREVVDLMLVQLERHLQLPAGTLGELHRINERSGDHIRFIQAAVQPYAEEKARMGEHTDFGTLTFLMNWLGGLQIRKPGTMDWVYVKPIPGSAVMNLGDALVKFTAGVLRSNVHRVVPPPAPQDNLLRHSLVYFSRPEDKVILRRLKGGVIDAQPEMEDEHQTMTAEEWTWRRSVGDLAGVYTHTGGLEKRQNLNTGTTGKF